MIVVQFSTIDEFIGELRNAPDAIIDKLVRWRVTHAAEQKECVSYSVAVWATALLRGSEDADYLLELGLPLGSSDKKDSPVEKKATELEFKLKTACQECGLKVRPGKIEVF